MSTPDAAEIRATLKAHGVEVKDRGKLSEEHKAEYARIIGQPGPGLYDAGVTEADFDPAAADELGELADVGGFADLADVEIDGGPAGPAPSGDQIREERRPGPAPGPGWRERMRIGTGPRPSGKKAPSRPSGGRRKPKSAREWIPTGPFIERVWGELAWSARRMPPIQRVMVAQAPMVGVTMQDAARDTFIDRVFLQRGARAEERLEAVNATIGPVFWTMMIMRLGGFEVEPAMKDGHPIVTEDGPVMQPVIDPATGMPDWNDQTRVMLGGLRMSLMSWLRIGQRHAAEIIQRAEELDELGDQADALIAYILSPPRPRQSFRDMQREARMRFGQFMDTGGPGDPEPGTGEAGPPVPTPAPATPGQDRRVVAGVVVARDPASHPYPPTPMAPDPRTLSFMPPDAGIASQVVPRAPMPQG